MEGLGGNLCRGEGSMTLRGIFSHSGAANELGQAAMAASSNGSQPMASGIAGLETATCSPVTQRTAWPESEGEIPPALR
jgi:hypothetical protein